MSHRLTAICLYCKVNNPTANFHDNVFALYIPIDVMMLMRKSRSYLPCDKVLCVVVELFTKLMIAEEWRWCNEVKLKIRSHEIRTIPSSFLSILFLLFAAFIFLRFRSDWGPSQSECTDNAVQLTSIHLISCDSECHSIRSASVCAIYWLEI